MHKKCKGCKQLKLKSDFTFKSDTNDKLCRLCKECTRKSGKDYYNNNKEKEKLRKTCHRTINRVEVHKFLLDYFAQHPCVVCGETDPTVLEFDHLDKKNIEISKLMTQGNLSKVKEEIKLCQVLCAKDQQWWTLKTIEQLEAVKNEAISTLKSISPKVRRC